LARVIITVDPVANSRLHAILYPTVYPRHWLGATGLIARLTHACPAYSTFCGLAGPRRSYGRLRRWQLLNFRIDGGGTCVLRPGWSGRYQKSGEQHGTATHCILHQTHLARILSQSTSQFGSLSITSSICPDKSQIAFDGVRTNRNERPVNETLFASLSNDWSVMRGGRDDYDYV
jgi:hypothetical protein